MAVGNGAKTLFWEHKWVTNRSLRELATQPLPSEVEGATVDEMWNHGDGWRWDVFSPYLHQDTLKIIQAHELKEDPNLEIYSTGTILPKVIFH